MLSNALRIVLGFVAGTAAAFLLIIAVEVFSNSVYPLPHDVEATHDAICLHVAKYPAWILAVVVLAWGITTWLATWMAGRIGNVVSSGLLGLLLTAGVALNISMLPYQAWFEVVIMIAVPLAAIAGCLSARKLIAQAPELETRSGD